MVTKRPNYLIYFYLFIYLFAINMTGMTFVKNKNASGNEDSLSYLGFALSHCADSFVSPHEPGSIFP
jgi:hypothetical protein